mmetsp:Transcript_26453/g.58000  ORF Transcript_26453/g.58000 Transcript_26453/m.58000 type:complete len:312 (+) Transcript_26453:120-1055(+)
MIQRRGKADLELPLTSADTSNNADDSKGTTKKKPKRADSPALLLEAIIPTIIVVFGLLGLSHFIRKRRHHHHHHHSGGTGQHVNTKNAFGDHLAHHHAHHHGHEPRRIHPLDGERHLHKAAENELPLAKFSTLSHALGKADIVGLYFAASWCRMSAPITEALDEAFSGKRNTLLYPDEVETYDADAEGRKPLSIVYVSSDGSVDEMTEYIRGGWLSVPYESIERTELKKHFRVCAKRELEELGFERKFEIPTLILIDGKTHGVISTNGVEDIKEYGDKALQHWLGMKSLIGGLEDKYEDEALRNNPEPRIV